MPEANAAAGNALVEQEQDVDMEGGFQKIEELQKAGINAGDIQKLKAAGFTTVASVVQVMRKTLGDVKGISEVNSMMLY